MQVRIDSKRRGSTTVISVTGRLSGLGAQELVRACRAVEGEFAMDLSNLLSADDEGIEALRRLRREARETEGASPFIELLLEENE
jgi:hypothetical protein